MEFEAKAHYPIVLDPLPQGWSAGFLNDVCTSIQSGFASGEHNATGDGIPHVRPMNINRLGQLTFDEVKYVAQLTDGRRLNRGDVVFNNTNSPVLIGKTCAVSTDVELGFSNHMTRLRPIGSFDYRFLANQLHYLWMAGYFLHRCVKHVNQASVSSQSLGSTVPIVLPPSTEQRRIVASIESHFTRLDDAVATLERVQRNLKRYRASVLKAAVEGRLVPTEAELARAEGRTYEPASVLLERILAERRRRWEEAELAKMQAKGKAPKDDAWKAKYVGPVAPDVCENLQLPEGWTWASLGALTSATRVISYGILMPKDNVPGGVPYVKVRDMRSGVLDVRALQRTSIEIAAKYPRSRLRAGDLLLAIRGTYGRVVDVPVDLEGGNITQDSARLDMLPGVDRRYGKWMLLSPDTEMFYKRVARGVAVKGVNISDVRATPVPLPPMAEQVRIVQEIEDLLSIEEAHEKMLASSVLRIARLRQSILKWAFEGRLVDQDPTDEPASALLERIRAERDSTTAPTSRPQRSSSVARKTRV